MPESLIKSLAYQTLDALAYIHRSGFFHRDMKPENILITDKNVVKLADFGLVKESRSAPPFTDYVSTRWYRAPELLLKAEVYNGKVDIFALACIIVELYLLAPLFAGEDEMDQLSKIVSILGTPPQEWVFAHKQAKALGFKFKECEKVNLRNIIPGASSQALDLLDKMLVYDPTKRISAVDALKHPYFTDSIKTTSFTMQPSMMSLDNDSKNNQSEILGKKPKASNPRDVGRSQFGAFQDDSFGASPNEASQPSMGQFLKSSRILDDLDDFTSLPVAPKPNHVKGNAATLKTTKTIAKPAKNNVFEDDLDFFFSSSPVKQMRTVEKKKTVAVQGHETPTLRPAPIDSRLQRNDTSARDDLLKNQRGGSKDPFENVLEAKFRATKGPVNGYVPATLKPSQKSPPNKLKKLPDPIDDWDEEAPKIEPSRGFLY